MKEQRETGKMKKKKKNSNGHMIELVTSMGIWGAIPLGTSEEPCRMCLKIVP